MEAEDLAIDDDPTAISTAKDPAGDHAVFLLAASEDKNVAAEDGNHAAKAANDSKAMITAPAPLTSFCAADYLQLPQLEPPAALP
ncbi:hypothetical protein L7F22_017724 [Adiantum nelumboides]|nr:hypothetical protein [Adiantum nelumboides]